MSHKSLVPWLGDQQSHDDLLSVLLHMDANPKLAEVVHDAGYVAYNQEGNVAIIDVHGPMTSRDLGDWARGYAVTYTNLRNDLVHAASSPTVGGILLDIASGGGDPNGLPDIIGLITQIRASGMPVWVYASGAMCSAAMWVGAAAEKRYGSMVSVVGSIGCYMVHREFVKMMEQDGVTSKVIRDVPNKGMGDSSEPLSAEAEAKLQTMINDLGSAFRTDAGTLLALPADKWQKASDASVFVGKAAVSVGLLTGLSTLDKTVGLLQKQINQSAKARPGQEVNPMARKKLMTPAVAELMAVGASEEAALEAAGVDDPTAEPSATPAAETPPVAAETPAAADPNPLVAYLQTENAGLRAELAAVKEDLRVVTAGRDSLQATHPAMRVIVENGVKALQIKTNSARVALDHLDDAALLAQHGALLGSLMSLPVGAVSALESIEPPAGQGGKRTTPTAADKARVASTRL